MIAGLRAPALHAAGAALGAAAIVWFGPPGTDLAAHVYQRSVFLEHGFAFWNNFWYAGRYSFVSYSLLYYPLAALVGIKLLAVASIGVAAGAFAALVDREWRTVGPWPAAAFSGVSAAFALTAAFPYALGLAAALLSLLALRASRLGWFSALVVLTFAASPLAFVLLVVVLAGIAAARTSRKVVRPAVVVACTALAGALLWRAFPDRGRFPFSTAELAASLTFCALGIAFTWRVERARILTFVFGAYGLACLGAFVVPSAIGENVARLRFVAIPLAVLALSLRGWRPLVPALGAFALAFSWNFTPLAFSVVRSSADPSSEASYWRPAIRYLNQVRAPSYRVEAVDTTGHWEAVYLARAGIPIARGWFRQDDFPQNRILYDRLSRRSYLLWLRRMGVGYVVLTDAPTDYSARGEARLLRSGRSGLRPVFRSVHSTVFAVPSPVGIVTGPGRPRVVAFHASSLTMRLTRPGRYRVALRHAPYWTATGACVAKRPDGMIDLHAVRAGVVRMRFVVTPGRAAAAVVAGEPTHCP